MAAGRRNLQCTLGRGLAFDVGQVRVVRLARPAVVECAGPALTFGRGFVAGQKLLHHVQQVAGAVDAHVGHQRRFLCAAFGQHQLRQSRAGAARQGQTHGQRAPHRPQVAAQRELARKLEARQLGAINLSAGRQNAQRDRQVKTPRVLGQVGRRQVDGDAFVARKLQPAVLDGRAHPLAGFLDFCLCQPDQGEARQTVGQVNLHRDRFGLQTEQRPAVH